MNQIRRGAGIQRRPQGPPPQLLLHLRRHRIPRLSGTQHPQQRGQQIQRVHSSGLERGGQSRTEENHHAVGTMSMRAARHQIIVLDACFFLEPKGASDHDASVKPILGKFQISSCSHIIDAMLFLVRKCTDAGLFSSLDTHRFHIAQATADIGLLDFLVEAGLRVQWHVILVDEELGLIVTDLPLVEEGVVHASGQHNTAQS